MYPFNLRKIVEAALNEDLVFHDPVASSLEKSRVECAMLAKGDLVFCGKDIVMQVFHTLDGDITLEFYYEDGDVVASGSRLGVVKGFSGGILRGERVALNFTQRLSGIATITRKFVEKIEGTGVKICDTRKTTPLLRYLEKYAVRCGGGVNHRFSLSDGVLIKDNAIKVFGSINEAVSRVKEKTHHLLKIQVEVENLDELREALKSGVDAVLLDNMSREEVTKAVSLAKGKVILEVSGNITLENVRAYAETGVDIISSGALTHSAPSVDISLEVCK
ncbi:MAG: carboxylating nicotinate-nucleotide diphosphorylase [Deltaproteobacteria bacterium]|nr:carboxylating nicotinate-nucleotide diphosphorylase [Deltaproteobacteria bacterium]NIS76607.1 carboxylating nicotinate-nucleotide diphosphorylase [Deltaproteobacteria bacterium]